MTSLQAEPGTVDLVLVSFSRLYDKFDRLERHLSPDERLRGERLIDPERRRSFWVGRGFLRETLGRYLQVAPEKIRLDVGENGKPSLGSDSTNSKSPSLRFNISHAGDLLLLAVALGNEVGVDLEVVDPGLEYGGMAERFFSEAERLELATLPETERRAAFYRGWVRKEAFLKGLGSGFSRRSDSFDVGLDAASPRIMVDRVSPDEAQCWSLMDVAVPGGYVAALAYWGEQPKVRWAERLH